VSLAGYFLPHTFEPGTQISSIVHHPIGYLGVLVRSVGRGFGRSGWLSGFVSSVGFYPVGPSPTPPVWVAIVAFLVLGVAYGLEFGPRRRQSSALGLVSAVTPIVLFVAGVFAVFTTLWIEWTAVGSSVINGLQGRYLLPLAAVPVVTVVLFTKRSWPPRWSWPVVVGMTVLGVAEVAIVLGTFY